MCNISLCSKYFEISDNGSERQAFYVRKVNLTNKDQIFFGVRMYLGRPSLDLFEF